MLDGISRKRLWIFLAFAFGLAWATGGIVALTGGIANSPLIVQVPGFTLTLATVLIATGYMWSPAIAVILTRLITRQGWQNAGLHPRFKQGWKHYLAAWLLPVLITIFGAAVFFVVMPRYYDPQMGAIRAMLAATGAALPFPPVVFILLQLIQALIAAPLINSLFTFGEEFGWRGYLLPALMPLGGRKAVLLSGVIWGIWHAPVIAMGHNFGLEYPGFPWAGILAMTWFTILAGAFLAWVTIKAGSVWPAVIGHAMINGIAAIGSLMLKGEPPLLLGPTPVGIIGGVGFLVLAIIVLTSNKAFTPVSISGIFEKPTLPEE